jgi:IclR family KDG regulon transcriptional repressor
MAKASSVQTIDRLVTILDCFSPEHPTWSLAELSTHLALPKTTLHRFLVSLESHGILRRDPDSMKWRLGYRLVIWGHLAAESTNLQHIARPVLRDLVQATNETAILTVYHNQEVICMDKVETSHSVRLTLEVGTRRPPHAGASSKVLLAFLPDEEIKAIIDSRGLPKLCKNTITDPAELCAELSRIRACGYAYSHEETDLGAWGVATPIVGRESDVVAAVGVAGPSSRFTDDLVHKYVALCDQAAARISTMLRQGIE